MNIKRTCTFVPDKEKERPDAKLRFRIRWKGKAIAFNVGYRVDLDKWISDAQRCKTNTTHGKKHISASVINHEIMRYEDAANALFYEFEQKGIDPSEDEFREEFNIRIGKIDKRSRDKGFFECYGEFIISESREKSWTSSTIKKHMTVKRHLCDFSANLNFSDLNEKGLSKLTDFFLHDAGKSESLRNSTVKKNIKILKWFLRWATKKGYNTELAFINYIPKLKTIPKKVIFLTWDETMKVYNTNIPEGKKYLVRVKDMLLFCCFTSLRYSDMQNLKWSSVYDDYIEVTTVKTDDSLKIELNNYSREILEKMDKTNEYVFPRLTNQKMNEYLKELGEICGLDSSVTIIYYKGSQRIEEIKKKYEMLTTHIGRRTFICNALMLGISPNIVMKWTGHSDYDSMKPYIDIADRAKETAMNMFNR